VSNERGLPIAWPELRLAFIDDGSLRDIVVPDTSEADWRRALDFLRARGRDAGTQLTTEPEPLPERVQDIFGLWDEQSVCLRFVTNLLDIKCHFFGPGQIELDVHPGQLATPDAAAALLVFMRELGEAVGRRVLFTDENRHDPMWVWLTYDPTTRAWAKGQRFDVTLGPGTTWHARNPAQRLADDVRRRARLTLTRPDRRPELLAEVRALVWDWDPVGLASLGSPRDEYDCLVGPIASALVHGLSSRELAARLRTKISDHFGVQPPSTTARFASEARVWYATRGTRSLDIARR
jgi:hypothetical protein